MTEKREPEKVAILWIVLLHFVLFGFEIGCSQGGSAGDSQKRATIMKLTSQRAEIVVNSAKVPGYWATDNEKGRRFFLFLWSLDDSYKNGDVLAVEGAYGGASAVVFDDETRVYRSGVPIIIYVAWKAKKPIP